MKRDTKGLPGEFEQFLVKGQAYGIASIARVLHGAVFPMTKADLIGLYGDEDVQLTPEHSVTFEALLDRSSKQVFRSLADLAPLLKEPARKSSVRLEDEFENTRDDALVESRGLPYG